MSVSFNRGKEQQRGLGTLGNEIERKNLDSRNKIERNSTESGNNIERNKTGRKTADHES